MGGVGPQRRAGQGRLGGFIGVNVVPYFVVRRGRPTLDQFIAHIDHWAKVAGIDHVGLGFDYFDGQQPFGSDEEADRVWRAAVDSGRWNPDTYPRPPHYYPEGLSTPAELRNLTRRLLERGDSAGDTQKILAATGCVSPAPSGAREVKGRIMKRRAGVAGPSCLGELFARALRAGFICGGRGGETARW